MDVSCLEVCIDVRDLPPGMTNGTGVHAVELLRHLPRNIEPWALVSGPEQRAVLEELGLRTVETVKALPGCRVFHRPSQIYDAAGLELFLHPPAPPVLSCLDLISYRTPALFADFAAFRRYRGLLFASLQSAEAVLVSSEHARREILDEFYLPPARVHCTHLGVDAARFGTRDEENNRAVLRRHGIAAPYFFCSGSDFPHKNLALLLRGYAWFRSRWKGPDAAPGMVLIGQRSGAPGGIFDLGPSPAAAVRYLGAVERDDVPALYQEALAFVYPTAYEGFGLPVLEAMAAGIPVLCSRLTSLPEVAGDAALYLDELSMEELAEGMTALAADSGLRRRLIEAGKRRAQTFTWEETARKTAEIYAAVAEHPSRDAALQRRMIAGVAGIAP